MSTKCYVRYRMPSLRDDELLVGPFDEAEAVYQRDDIASYVGVEEALVVRELVRASPGTSEAGTSEAGTSEAVPDDI